MNAPSALPETRREAPPTPARRPLRALAATVGVVLFFVVGGLFLLVRDVVLPRADEYRPQIARVIGDAIGLPVSIDAISADLSGLHPRLRLSGVRILDGEGRPALSLGAVDATIAWSSLLRGRAYFHRIEIGRPELALRRDADGRVFVAGLPVGPGGEGGGFSDWLFGQREIVVRDAALSWTDAQRAAPELRLDAVDLRLWQSGGRHRFGLRARPPAALAGALDVRGDLTTGLGSGFRSATGELFVSLDAADLGGWRAWIDYPVELAGRGSVRAWLAIAEGFPNALTAVFSLSDAATRLAADLPALQLVSAHGRLSVARASPDEFALSTRALELVTTDGLRIEPADIDLSVRGRSGDRPRDGVFTANRLDLAALAGLAVHLPLDPATRERLAAFAPSGRVEDARFAWEGPAEAPTGWRIAARFADVALMPSARVPGLAGLSGELSGDDRAGRFHIAGENAALDLPAVFPESRLAFSLLRADGGWTRDDGQLEIALDSASFENPDAAGSAVGRYRFAADGPGEIDLSARLTRADSGAVWRYLPRVVNRETRDWLRRSVTGGVVPDARLRLKGNLADFPFGDGKSGQFLVTTRVAGARLAYAEGWPAITDVHGELRFEGRRMRIAVERARILDVALNRVVADVPELNAPGGEIMTVRGRASGATSEFLRFVSESPVSRRIGGFTDGIRAEGDGALDLKLVMPLRDLHDTTVDGEYRFADNRVRIVDALPALEGAAGAVRFSENTLTIPEARARLYGEPVRLTAATGAAGAVRFDARGAASMNAVRLAHGWPVLAHLSGAASWNAAIDVVRSGTRVVVESDLSGVASSLPQPMNKRAAESWPSKVVLDFAPGGERVEIRAGIDERAELELVRARRGEGWAVERGGLALFVPLRSAEAGVLVAAKLDEFDLDRWRDALASDDTAADGRETGGAPSAVPLAGVELGVSRARAFGQPLTDLTLGMRPVGGGWLGSIASREVEGRFEWRDEGDGALKARLARLDVAGDADAGGGRAEREDTEEDARRLPALDVVADAFRVRNVALGRLELQARNRGGLWHLDSLALANADGRLTGTGQWRPGARALTELDFRLEAHDIGRFITRLGYGEAVRGGTALLAGALRWNGPPTRIDYPSLSGALTLEAENGQFHKLEPGVGRLFGVLSLQALPRRLTLDFRDVFSEGFAFDRISGSIDVTAGVMRTNDLLIRGPAARVQMRGSADLDDETQDVRVTVQPTLSESIAIGAAAGLINPVAGVVAYVAQKALSDPIEKLFAFDYAVTGSWSDPKVERLGRARGAESDPKQE